MPIETYTKTYKYEHKYTKMNEYVAHLKTPMGSGFRKMKKNPMSKKMEEIFAPNKATYQKKKSSNDYFIVRWHARGAWGGPTAWGIGLKNGHRLVWGRVRSAGE